MADLILTVVLSASLSSLLTILLLSIWLKRRFLPEAERRVQAVLAERSEELGELIEERVRTGAREGITEGLSTLPSPERLAEGLQGATQTVGRAARSLVGSGLSGLMGGGTKPRRD